MKTSNTKTEMMENRPTSLGTEEESTLEESTVVEQTQERTVATVEERTTLTANRTPQWTTPEESERQAIPSPAIVEPTSLIYACRRDPGGRDPGGHRKS